MKRNQPLQSRRQPAARRGATLTEVLMGVMLMGIGVATLASLFPISVLRSIQATQLTNSTLLRMNTEDLINTLPELLHDPDRDGNFAEHNGRAYMVDPLGWNEVDPTLQSRFGNDGTNPAGTLIRYNGGQTSSPAAQALAMQPDSWVEHTQWTPALAGSTSLFAPAEIDLSDFPVGAATVPTRAILFSGSGKQSQIRADLYINGQELMFTDTANIPELSDISRVILQYQEQRYSWLLTVRKSPGAIPTIDNASVDVVVFFRRSFGPEDEQLLDATFQRLNNKVTVTGLDPDPKFRPFYKKGGYILDAENAHWYRIAKVNESSATELEITLDRPAIDSGNSAILMRRIVDVYPLGTFNPPPP